MYFCWEVTELLYGQTRAEKSEEWNLQDKHCEWDVNKYKGARNSGCVQVFLR